MENSLTNSWISYSSALFLGYAAVSHRIQGGSEDTLFVDVEVFIRIQDHSIYHKRQLGRASPARGRRGGANLEALSQPFTLHIHPPTRTATPCIQRRILPHAIRQRCKCEHVPRRDTTAGLQQAEDLCRCARLFGGGEEDYDTIRHSTTSAVAEGRGMFWMVDSINVTLW